MNVNDRRDATFLTPREQEIVGAVIEILQDTLRQRDAQIGELLTRVAALEQRKAFAYLGIWDQDEQYREGDFVTHSGSLWHCDSAMTRARPGTSERLATRREARARRMRLPQTLAQINATLRARDAAGLSVEVVDVSGEPLRDGRGGLFMRLRFVLDDGDEFQIDTAEASEFLRACMAQPRHQRARRIELPRWSPRVRFIYITRRHSSAFFDAEYARPCIRWALVEWHPLCMNSPL